MANLKQQLIRLGNEQPGLRKHLRVVLDEIRKRPRHNPRTARWDNLTVVNKGAYNDHELNVLNMMVIAAENEGRFYPDQPEKAVEVAARDLKKQYDRMLGELKKEAIKEVRASWKAGKNAAYGRGYDGADSVREFNEMLKEQRELRTLPRQLILNMEDMVYTGKYTPEEAIDILWIELEG